MTLLITADEARRLIDPKQAMQALEAAMIEEAEGTTFSMPPFGGAKSERRTFRTVGGGLYGLRRMGIRFTTTGHGPRGSGATTNLLDTDTGELLAIIAGATDLRIGATLALGARSLAR